jgi:hypothetical protein
MYSEIIPWQEFINAVLDDTGLTDISNHEDLIRRSIYRTERDIGFGASLLLYKKTYTLTEDAGDVRIRLPENIIGIEDVGMCYLGFCPNTYKIQGNYIFICDDRIKAKGEFTLFYYVMQTDAEGNPIIIGNHYEALLTGVSLQLYRAKRFESQGNANQYAIMLQEYDDRVGEARGSDVMPTTQEEWKEIASMLNMSKVEYLIYDMRSRKYCCSAIDVTDEIVDVPDPVDPPTPTIVNVYYWQYTDLSLDISEAPNIDQDFLNLQDVANVNTFANGQLIDYSSIGRVAFAIQETTEDNYRFFDNFNQDITELTFDTYYNSELNTQIYISKNIQSIGQVYFKITS